MPAHDAALEQLAKPLVVGVLGLAGSEDNKAEDSNFDAGTALEDLRAEVVDIEALAR